MDAIVVVLVALVVLPEPYVGPAGDAAEGHVELAVREHRRVEYDADLMER